MKKYEWHGHKYPKGNIPWNKGKHGVYTDETKQKMKNSHADVRGEKNPMFGRHLSDTTKQKISGKKLGKSSWSKGKKRPDISGKNHYFYGKQHTEETKQKLREKTKENWKNRELAQKMIAPLKMKPNGHELYLDFLLQNYFPDKWEYTGDGCTIINGLNPDFIDGGNKIIEYFGEHWHTGEGIRGNLTEEGRRKIFAETGYDLLVIWESELLNEQKVIEKIRLFTGKP